MTVKDALIDALNKTNPSTHPVLHSPCPSQGMAQAPGAALAAAPAVGAINWGAIIQLITTILPIIIQIFGGGTPTPAPTPAPTPPAGHP